jgi:hypothetical protein
VQPVSQNAAWGFETFSHEPQRGALNLRASSLPDELANWQFAVMTSLTLVAHQWDLENIPGILCRNSTVTLSQRRAIGMLAGHRDDFGQTKCTYIRRNPISVNLNGRIRHPHPAHPHPSPKTRYRIRPTSRPWPVQMPFKRTLITDSLHPTTQATMQIAMPTRTRMVEPRARTSL